MNTIQDFLDTFLIFTIDLLRAQLNKDEQEMLDVSEDLINVLGDACLLLHDLERVENYEGAASLYSLMHTTLTSLFIATTGLPKKECEVKATEDIASSLDYIKQI